MRKPIFITLEGIEGVGKSTLLREIEAYFTERNIPYKTTREPGGTPLAEKLRELLKDKEYTIDPITEALMMFASRSHHVNSLIRPSLEKGISIISDRYVEASYAYQGGGRGVDIDSIKALDKLACQEIQPDHIILITAPVDVAMKRVMERKNIDRFEKETHEFFERVQNRYLEMAQGDNRYIILDGSQELDSIKAQLREELKAIC